MSKKWSLWAFLALFLPSAGVLGIHTYIGSFNRFIADDFCSIFMVQRLGYLRSIWYWYISWFGDYSASLLDGILPVIGVRGLTYVVGFTLILWVTLAVWAIWLGLPRSMEGSERNLAALSMGTALVFVTLLLSPNVIQSLYWWGGMRGYIPPLLFATFYLVLFQLFVRKVRSSGEQVRWGALSFLVSFFGCGFSETFTPVHVVLVAGLLFFGLTSHKIKSGDQVSTFLLTGLGGSILALGVMVLAPGNSIRQSFFPATPGLMMLLSISLKGYAAFLAGVFGSVENVCGVIGLSLAAIWLGFRTAPDITPKGWVAPLSLLTGFVLAFGCFPSSAYGMSDVPPDRTLVTAVYFLTVCLGLAGYTFGQWLNSKQGAGLESRAQLGLAMGALIFIFAAAALNGWTLAADSHQYRDYALNWDRMNARILQAKADGQTQVIIPIMTNWAGLDNPGDNPKFWLNVCFSKYYEINVLTPPVDR